MLPPAGAPQTPLSRALLDEEGFALWTAELLDEHRNGVALSWGFGQPETRLGAAGPARGFPGLSVLIFSGGRPMVWLHQRYDEDEAGWHAPAGRWTFGKSQIEVLRDAGAQVVIARIDCPLPGTGDRLAGTVEVAGPPRRQERASPDDLPDEDWAPLCGPGKARVALQIAQRPFTLLGRGHHGRHGARRRPDEGLHLSGQVPLEDTHLAFELRLPASSTSDPGPALGQGLVVDDEGRSRPVSLRAEGELAALAGPEPENARGARLLVDDDAWLKLEQVEALHRRPGGGHFWVTARTPMSVPRPGLLRVAAPASAGHARQRRFVHAVGGPNAWLTPLEVGLVQERHRWRRLLRR